jgi:hypothetical protein
MICSQPAISEIGAFSSGAEYNIASRPNSVMSSVGGDVGGDGDGDCFSSVRLLTSAAVGDDIDFDCVCMLTFAA